MINVRYHIYSLVAVFLALAIGVAAGSTVVQRAVVDNLRSTQDRIEKNLDSLEAENGDLQARTAALEKRANSLSDAGPTTLLANELNGMPVVLVRVEGVAGDVLDRVRSTLGVAGAEVVADIELKAASADPDTLGALAEQLDLPSDQRQPEAVQNAVGDQLGSLLAAVGTASSATDGQATTDATDPTGTAPTVTDPQPSPEARALRDYADALDSAGVVSVRGPLGKDAHVTADGAVVLIVGGLTTQFDPVPLLRPLLDGLVDADRQPALVADAGLDTPPDKGQKASGIVATVRNTGQLRDHVSTVDVLDDFAGLAAMVLGLADLADGQIGHYGVGEGADALLPHSPHVSRVSDVAPDAAIGRSTATISVLTLVSRVSGFARVLVVTAVLGTTALGDVYQTANLVPNILFELFAAGSIQAVMVPSLVAADERGGAPEGERLANAVLGWLLATLGTLAAVALVGAPLLMRLLTAAEPDATLRADKAALGTRFLALFVVQLLFYAMGLVATALLQARRRFAAPAIAPLFNNLVVIGAYLLFDQLRGGEPPSLSLSGLEIAVLAGGTTLGVAVFTSVPALAAARSGVRWRPTLRRDPAVSRLARQGAWAGAYLGLTQLLILGVLVLGNAVDGTVARFTFAFTFFQLPYALIAVPVATARYPAMASAVLGGGGERLTRLVGDGVVTTVAGCAAASAALLALAWPLVHLTAYGEVAGDALGPLAHAIAAFAPGLIGYGLFYLLTRVRYAQGDVRSPTMANALVAMFGLAAMAVGAAVVADADRAAALAAAFGGAQLVGAIVLGVITGRSLGRHQSLGVARGIVASIVVAVGAGVVMAAVSGALDVTGRVSALVAVVLAGTAGVVVLVLALPPATGRPLRVLLGASGG